MVCCGTLGFNGTNIQQCICCHFFPQRKVDQTLGNCTLGCAYSKVIFGTKAVWFGKPVEMADPSRTLIDILDLPSFGGGMRHTIDIIKNIGLLISASDLLLQYAVNITKARYSNDLDS